MQVIDLSINCEIADGEWRNEKLTCPRIRHEWTVTGRFGPLTHRYLCAEVRCSSAGRGRATRSRLSARECAQ